MRIPLAVLYIFHTSHVSPAELNSIIVTEMSVLMSTKYDILYYMDDMLR